MELEVELKNNAYQSCKKLNYLLSKSKNCINWIYWSNDIAKIPIWYIDNSIIEVALSITSAKVLMGLKSGTTKIIQIKLVEN